jgi:hypothetical protein
MTDTQQLGKYSPLTKSIDVDEVLMLIQLSQEMPTVAAWQEEALYRLPQASRQRRQEIIRSTQNMFLKIEEPYFIRTPLVELLSKGSLASQFKRDLLLTQFLQATPLVWQALKQVILPLLESKNQSLAQNGRVEIPRALFDDFLQKQLRQTTQAAFDRTRGHITAHLTKFGIMESQPVPGNIIAKQFFAHFYQPDVRAFWFSLTQEFTKHAWTSRSEQFICERSWTRTAFCATSAYARFALDEAEKHSLINVDFFGAEKQFTLRGPDPWARLLEVIRYA